MTGLGVGRGSGFSSGLGAGLETTGFGAGFVSLGFLSGLVDSSFVSSPYLLKNVDFLLSSLLSPVSGSMQFLDHQYLHVIVPGDDLYDDFEGSVYFRRLLKSYFFGSYVFCSYVFGSYVFGSYFFGSYFFGTYFEVNLLKS